MKKTLAFFLLIFNTLSAWAATTFKSGDLYYKIVSDSEPYAVEVTYQTQVPNNNYSGLTEVEIPTTVKYNKTTYEVIGISWYAFHECADLRSVLIKQGLPLNNGRKCQKIMSAPSTCLKRFLCLCQIYIHHIQ